MRESYPLMAPILDFSFAAAGTVASCARRVGVSQLTGFACRLRRSTQHIWGNRKLGVSQSANQVGKLDWNGALKPNRFSARVFTVD
jgi:hypothetical protein